MTELAVEAPPIAPTDPTDVARDSPEVPVRGGLDVSRVSVLGWVVAALVLVQTLFWLPDATSVLPEKAAVLLPMAALGLPYLVAMALGRAGAGQNTALKWAARMGLAFLAWGALSASLAATPQAAFFGLYSDLTGWIFFLCLFGAWAVATRLSRAPDRSLLELSIIAGATGNAVVAVIQQHVDLSSVALPLYGGTLQPTGILGNPVYLGALLAAALALVAPRCARAPLRWGAVAIVLGLGLGVCGERLPAILTVLLAAGEVGAVAFAAWRAGAGGVRTVLRATAPMVLFGALAIGALVVGSVTAGTNTSGPVTQSSSPVVASPGAKPAKAAPPTIVARGGVIDHIQSSTSTETFNERFDLWRASWSAFLHRPLTGYGPDQFRVGTLSRYDSSLVLDVTTDIYTDQVFLDAHNILIELAVTVGIVGLGLFAGWLVFALRRRRGPLVVFAIVLFASELAEPLNLVITTLLFVAVGAALQRNASEPMTDKASATIGFAGRRMPERRLLAGSSWVLGALALIPALLFIIGDIAYDAAATAPPLAPGTASNVSTAETLLSPWSQPASEWATIYSTPYLDAMPQALQWEEVAVARDRTNPVSLVLLASMDADLGNLRGAHGAAAAAVENQPWLAPALDLLGAIDWNQGQRSEARQVFKQSLGYYPNQPLVEAYLSGQCVPALPGSLATHGLSIGCGTPGQSG